MSAFDPKRTFGRTWCPFQSVSLSQQDTLLVGSKAAMKRREFITFVGVAAVLPLAASAQSKIPRIGFMGNSTAALEANLVTHSVKVYASLAMRKAAILSSNTAGQVESIN